MGDLLHPVVREQAMAKGFLGNNGAPEVVALSEEVVKLFQQTIAELVQFVPLSSQDRAVLAIHRIIAAGVTGGFFEGKRTANPQDDGILPTSNSWTSYPYAGLAMDSAITPLIDHSASLSGYDCEPIAFPTDFAVEVERDDPLLGMFRNQEELVDISSGAA